jgi:hypothetical protein
MKSIVMDDDANDKLKQLLTQSVEATTDSRTGLLIGSVIN